MEQVERQYSNGEITVYWKPSACIHSSVCYTRLLEVFNPRRRPWVNMQGSSSQKIIEVVNQCPTDALTWKWDDDQKNETVTSRDSNHIRNRWAPGELRSAGQVEKDPEPVKIQVMKDGPLVVEGSFTITGSTGSQLKLMKMTSFCRCGHSRSMPFCDGSHRRAGFRDE